MERIIDSVQSSQTISDMKKKLIQLMRPTIRSIFNVQDLYGVQLHTQLQVEFSDLHSDRYNRNFHCPGPQCYCQTGIKETEHFLLHYVHFLLSVRPFLTWFLIWLDLCTLLVYGHNDFSFLVSYVAEETIK